MKRIAAVLLPALVLLLALAACTANVPSDTSGTQESPQGGDSEMIDSGGILELAPGEELLALAEDRTAAEALAEQYGIELVSFSDGVATFHTEEDPRAVVRRGQKNGWPELSLNHMNTAF